MSEGAPQHFAGGVEIVAGLEGERHARLWRDPAESPTLSEIGLYAVGSVSAFLQKSRDKLCGSRQKILGKPVRVDDSPRSGAVTGGGLFDMFGK